MPRIATTPATWSRTSVGAAPFPTRAKAPGVTQGRSGPSDEVGHPSRRAGRRGDVGQAGADHQRRPDRAIERAGACGPSAVRNPDVAGRAVPRRRTPPAGTRAGLTRAPRRPPLPPSRGRVRQRAGGSASSLIATADVRAVGLCSGDDPPGAGGTRLRCRPSCQIRRWTKTPAWEPIERGGDLVALVVHGDLSLPR